ncbi:hypothetical protein EVAR_51376_1 [Eumeta japonica]|uniref:Uncharacterized protein n=1 Tax=Eumeta variegata TaxID=151549 RepID=A0A4C1Y746_EUMVA|nr:hypothetical protein EVAR_51376_1 [Eumeta japonica]
MRDIRDALDDLRDYFIEYCYAGLQLSLRDGLGECGTVGRLKTSSDPMGGGGAGVNVRVSGVSGRSLLSVSDPIPIEYQ